ncbi:SDR family oxidoreductase [Candidatus Pelagibacter sp.]|nr:SDR family oxidoreductase [Candidatus Pelagibacter sp.]
MLQNKIVLISGVGKGIGENIFENCLSHANFTYGIVRNDADYKRLKLKHKKNNYKIFVGDIKNKKLIKKIILFSKKNKKKINCLVNNAGERQREDFLNINKKKIEHIFKNNFFSHFFITQEIVKQFLKQKKQNFSIVNIGSIVGVNGFKQLSGYASTKQALEGFTKSIAIEFAHKNIRANIIHPGFIKTSYYENFRNNKKNIYKWTLSRTPLKKWGNPSDVSNLVCFLLSDQSSYITGQSIICDGGWISG